MAVNDPLQIGAQGRRRRVGWWLSTSLLIAGGAGLVALVLVGIFGVGSSRSARGRDGPPIIWGGLAGWEPSGARVGVKQGVVEALPELFWGAPKECCNAGRGRAENVGGRRARLGWWARLWERMVRGGWAR